MRGIRDLSGNGDIAVIDDANYHRKPDPYTVSSNITTQNLVPAGVATPNSAVQIECAGKGTLVIQVTGTYTGALSLQGTIDGVVWTTFSSIRLVSHTGSYSATIGSGFTGLFQIDCSGYTFIRVTALAAVTGAAVVAMRTVDAASMVAVGPLPAGSNSIGTVGVAANQYINVGVSAAGGQGTSALSSYIVTAAASTNAALILTGARRLVGGIVHNPSAAAKYVKIFNKATAPITGTDTPVLIIPIPAGQIVDIPEVIGFGGMHLTLGLGIAITNLFAALDNTAVTAGDVNVSLLYL